MFVLLFIIEFVFLFLLARILIKSLSKLFFRISKNEKITVMLLSYLFLPGTIIHELSHLLAAGLLFVGAEDMELTPKITEDGVRLGSVGIAKTDLLRRAIIGVAPVLIGMAVIFGSLFYLQTLNALNLIGYLISLLIIFEVSNTLFSSRKDLEGCLEFLIAAAIIAAAIVIIRPEIAQDFLRIFQTRGVINFFKNADLFLIAPLTIDLVAIGLIRLLTGKK